MFDTTRRKVLGASVAGAGALIGAAAGGSAEPEGKIDLSGVATASEGLKIAATFPLIEAIQGRRVRRFAKGAVIPDGPLAYASAELVEPLSEMQQMLLLSTIAGKAHM